MKKTQYFQVEFKNVEVKSDDGKIIVEGYASTPDIDSYDDIVEPTAFIETMASYMSDKKGQVLLQHIREKIVGNTIDYRIDAKGLWVKVEFYNDIDGLYKNIQVGMISSFSIGFRALSWEYLVIEDRGIRKITKLELVEISAVNGPVNQNATFSISKSIKSFFDNLEGIKSFGIGAYEMKSQKIDDEEELIVDEEISVIEEEKKEEIIKEEEKPIEEVPQDVVTEEGEKETTPEETKTDIVETVGETPTNDDTDEVKADEMKALVEQVEALQKENEELKASISTIETEMKAIEISKQEIEKTLEVKENEIKQYLQVMPETLETKANTKRYVWSYYL